jgi:acyl-CoA reductase-like NAD-dependent aldehyde dehydrogenase
METRLLIGGEQVVGDGGELPVENPATEDEVARVGLPSAEQMDAAIGSAAVASDAWARMPAGERGELLHEVARRIRERTDELARVMPAQSSDDLAPRIDSL